MGKNKRKNFTPSALHELDEELRIVQTLNYRDVVWKTGDLVSLIEDDQEYHAQLRGLVLQRLQLPGAIIRWLIPNADTDHWEPGPDEERIIELSSLTARGAAPGYLAEAGSRISFDHDNWSKLRIDTPR